MATTAMVAISTAQGAGPEVLQPAPLSTSPTAEAHAMLSSGPAELAEYYQRFTKQNFPEVNLVLIDRAVNPSIRDEIQKGMQRALQRPDVAVRLPAGTDGLVLDRTVRGYINGLANGVAQDLRPGIAARHQSAPAPDLIEQAGAKLAPIVFDSAAFGVNGPQDSFTRCATPNPFVSAGQGLERAGLLFHELGHGIQAATVPFEQHDQKAVFHGRDPVNFRESTADSFRTLMTASLFGPLGQNFDRYNMAFGDYLAPRRDDAGAHLTHRAVAATQQWISENPEHLARMTPRELYRQAEKTAETEALTPDEVTQAVRHIEANDIARRSPNVSPESAAELGRAAAERLARNPAPSASYPPIAMWLDRTVAAGGVAIAPAIANFKEEVARVRTEQYACGKDAPAALPHPADVMPASPAPAASAISVAPKRTVARDFGVKS